MDSSLMVWHFKPQSRAYRFVGHKVLLLLLLLFYLYYRMPFILLISHRLVILWHQLHEIRQLDCGYLACTTCATHLFIYYLPLSLSFYSKGESTVFKAHTASVRHVQFSLDGQSLLTASDDKTVKVTCDYTSGGHFGNFNPYHYKIKWLLPHV